ncbi:hypothetical protein ACFZB5_13745 [Streptomyces nodosus]|uniref:hypothetical protein n=1 Tax=Streptomyces nodosus TaxID=40318 RepID=UPI0036E71063
MIVHDTATAFVVLVDTAILWARVLGAALAFVLCVAAFAVGPLIAPAMKTATGRLSGPSWTRGPLRARIFAGARTRRHSGRTRPLWVHSQPLDLECEEAA